MNAQDYCKKKTQASGSSFAYAFGFLSKEKSRAMMALYAFCREIDDIADDIPDKHQASQQIQQWRDEITSVFKGKPTHPVGKELDWARQHFAWDEELFYEILDGMDTDISAKPFIKNSDLSLYCYRVAGVVGLLSIDIFGYQNRQSRHFATTLGEALQLTNILRDIQEDAQRGRIYLPQCERTRFAVCDQDMIEGNFTHNLEQLLQYYIHKAENTYQKALQLLPADDRIALRPAIIMAAIYAIYLQDLKKSKGNIWKYPIHVSAWKKLRIAWQVWRYEKKYEKSLNSNKFPAKVVF
jgi:phytoene synthase